MSKKGFTLIELSIVIVILAIIGTFTMSFLVDNSRTYMMLKVQNELYQDGMYIIERISRDIVDSNGTTDCANGFNRAHIYKDTVSCIQYTLTGSKLYRNGQLIGRNVQSFTQDYGTVPYKVSIILEKECGMKKNDDGTTPKCKVDMATTVSPMNTNTTGRFNGNYEEVVYQ